MKRKVYYLSSPEDCVPRYVGCTKIPLKKRLIQHVYDAKRHLDNKSIWVKSLLERHIRPMITLVAEVQDFEDWEERERYYIALFREKYSLLNMADGGMGCPGTTHSEEWLEKVRATRSTQVNPLSKRVLCIETGEIYECGVDACKACGMSETGVSKAITSGGTCAGFHWRYVDENGEESNLKGDLFKNRPDKGWTDDSKQRMSEIMKTSSHFVGTQSGGNNYMAVPVVCVETGEIFGSASEASRHVGKTDTAVSKAVYTGGRCGGYHWEYMKDSDGNERQKRVTKSKAKSGADNSRARKVVCIETGEVFGCARDACRHLGMTFSAVGQSISEGRACGGYHWKYLDNKHQVEGV